MEKSSSNTAAEQDLEIAKRHMNQIVEEYGSNSEEGKAAIKDYINAFGTVIKMGYAPTVKKINLDLQNSMDRINKETTEKMHIINEEYKAKREKIAEEYKVSVRKARWVGFAVFTTLVVFLIGLGISSE